MWVWYCRPPIGAHFHPNPHPVPQQLGAKAHLRTVAAVLANATPACSRRRLQAGARLAVERRLVQATAVRRSHSSCYYYYYCPLIVVVVVFIVIVIIIMITLTPWQRKGVVRTDEQRKTLKWHSKRLATQKVGRRSLTPNTKMFEGASACKVRRFRSSRAITARCHSHAINRSITDDSLLRGSFFAFTTLSHGCSSSSWLAQQVYCVKREPRNWATYYVFQDWLSHQGNKTVFLVYKVVQQPIPAL